MSACTVRARLREDAHVVPNRYQGALLHLLLKVDGHATGVLASQRYAGLGAAWMAQQDALLYRKGREVTVWCAGFGADPDGRLRLFGVDHVMVRDRQTAMT